MENSSSCLEREFDKDHDVELAREFLKFTDRSKSPFHAVQAISEILSTSGFVGIDERDDWKGCIKPGGRYYTTRNGSTIVAFSVGSRVSAASGDTAQSNGEIGDDSRNSDGSRDYPAFSVVAAHTDSPCFKVKPVSSESKHGYLQVGVECYGGGLWHTWFDRDLTVAGRVVLRNSDDECPRVQLVSIERPILRIPNLAIHLSRSVNTDGFKVNKESDTVPIMATRLADILNASRHAKIKSAASCTTETTGGLKIITTSKLRTEMTSRHPPLLIEAVAASLQVRPEAIIDVDLNVADTQPAAIGGVLDEFVFAPRCDNLASCFTAVKALTDETDVDNACVRLIACFDHEEVGSTSAVGAHSSLLPSILRRISNALTFDFDRAAARSLLVSADMAHAVHPNYSSKHESNHRPMLGGGLVIKTNQNQRYATSGVSGFMVREAARRAGNVPVQEFVVPNDKPCGSTVGPFLASQTGIMTVDVGQPQLAMHSVREMCSVHDFHPVIQVFKQLLNDHQSILGSH